MLNLWYGDGFEDLYIEAPDADFPFLYEENWFTSDFSKRVLKECSGGVEVIVPNVFKCENGAYISQDKLSSGAKVLLILYYTDYSCEYLWCGDNCDPFIGDILEKKGEVTLVVSRHYIPDDNICKKYGVKLLNTGEIFYDEWNLMYSLSKHKLN